MDFNNLHYYGQMYPLSNPLSGKKRKGLFKKKHTNKNLGPGT